MEYKPEMLLKMKQQKARYNMKMANWYYGLYQELGGEIVKYEDPAGKLKLRAVGDVPETFFNKGDRIASCCDFWSWNVYHRNKLMDLQRVNRCKNSRFCPNCKMLNVSKFIHEFRSVVPQLEDYDFYLLTLTVPSENCDGDRLREMISDLYSRFNLFNRKFSESLFTSAGKPSKRALQERFVTFSGGVRVLEITYNAENGFHPHLHCIVCVKKGSVNPARLRKDLQGRWSNKRQSYNLKSDIDYQIGKAWSMLWYGVDFRKWDSYEYSVSDTYAMIDGNMTEYKNLEVDFAPMDDGGVYEVFKYTFKSSDIANFGVFKALEIAMAYKRVRQGFGILRGLKCDDDSDGELQPLELEIEEEPIEMITREFDELLTTFADYRKISRFQPDMRDDFVNSIAD